MMFRLVALPISAILVLVAAAGLTGCSPAAAPQAAAPAAPQVGVLTVQPRHVAIKTELPGRTAPTMIAEVRPQVTGLIQSRNFREGAEVAAGSTLYQLDPATYQAAYDSAMAAVAKAEASMQTARLKAGRYKELVAIKFVSQQDYDEAAALLRQSEADVAAARATAETAHINLGYTKVAAPITGRVGKSTVTAGALVTANQQTAMATIQQLNPIYVDVTQSSAEVLRLKRAMANGELKKTQGNAARVTLLLEDGSSYPHEGALQFSDVTVDPATGAITLRALFPNPQGLLLPGMYVRAVVEEGVREAAIVIPQQAVARDSKGDAIAMVVGADGKVEARKLRIARTLGNDWLVDGGLQSGEQVIVEGLQRVRPGAAVQAVERRAEIAADGAASSTTGPTTVVTTGASAAGAATGAAGGTSAPGASAPAADPPSAAGTKTDVKAGKAPPS